MRKALCIAVIAAGALSLAPSTAGADTLDGCVATHGSPCQIVAGPASDNLTTADGTVLVGGRGSWIAVGDWTVEMFDNADCTGEPIRTWSSELDDNLVDDVAGSNNGGGFYELCTRATANTEGSFVLLGALWTGLLP